MIRTVSIPNGSKAVIPPDAEVNYAQSNSHHFVTTRKDGQVTATVPKREQADLKLQRAFRRIPGSTFEAYQHRSKARVKAISRSVAFSFLRLHANASFSNPQISLKSLQGRFSAHQTTCHCHSVCISHFNPVLESSQPISNPRYFSPHPDNRQDQSRLNSDKNNNCDRIVTGRQRSKRIHHCQ